MTGASRGQSEQAGLPHLHPPASLHPASACLAGPMGDEGWCQGSAQSCCWGGTGQALRGVEAGARAWGAGLLSGCDLPGPPPTVGSAGHTLAPRAPHTLAPRASCEKRAAGSPRDRHLEGSLSQHFSVDWCSCWDKASLPVAGSSPVGCTGGSRWLFCFHVDDSLSLPFPSL